MSKNPRPMKLTEDQETEIASAEKNRNRAQILQLGVGEYLKVDGYDLGTASEILAEASLLRRAAAEVANRIKDFTLKRRPRRVW